MSTTVRTLAWVACFLGLFQVTWAVPVKFAVQDPNAVLLGPLPPQPRGFNQILAFGDSLTDGGGAWAFTNHTWPSDPHYYRHRFSNGPVYVDRLGEMLAVPVHNHAIGGATTNNTLVQGFTGPNSTIPVPSVLEQVQLYLDSADAQPAKTLFIINGGGNNDIFGNVSAEDTVRDTLATVDLLRNAGGKYFLLPTMLARPKGSEFAAETYQELLRTTHDDSTIVVADFFALFADILEDPRKFGFDPALRADYCLKGIYEPLPGGGIEVCEDPSIHVWWDEYHPTKRAHDIMGRLCLKSLILAGWL